MSATAVKIPTRATANWLWNFSAQAFGNGWQILTTPGTLLALIATNKNSGTILYLQFFDSASTPAGSAVPTIAPILLPISSTTRIIFNLASAPGYDGAQPFANGIYAGISTAAGIFTADASSSVWLDAVYTS